jgi:hypothetical protein
MGNFQSSPVWNLLQIIAPYLEECSEEEIEESVAQKKRNRHRNRGYALEEVDYLSDSTFYQCFE